MSEITNVKIAFPELVETMAKMRKEGGDAVKKENFLDFAEINEGVEFDSRSGYLAPSFGYIERLFRKLAAQYGQKEFALVKIRNYREACGYFSGQLSLYSDDAADLWAEMEFTWEGKGAIENTWDSFSVWQMKA